ALVRRLVESGAKPAIAVRKAWQVAPMRELFGGADGLVAVVAPGDGEAAAGFLKGARDSLGPVAAVLSAAGAFRTAEIGRDRAGDDTGLFEANFVATHTLVRAVVGADCVGTPIPGMGLYQASKAALHAYAEVLAAEVADHGVAVAVVAPGVLDTEANRSAMPDADRSSWTPVEHVVDALLDAAAGGAVPGALTTVRVPAPVA
ncbi:MAG: SDR family NAD(P)-dependent oxidoreductase, partial [Planctomycetota bacterium]|nr:SDR family NAD(P)-dependent oxidoreductase [Planctomycetota bacterium]